MTLDFPEANRELSGTLLAEATRVMDWRRAANLLGETVREMGVLIVVFAPLEAIFTDVLVNTTLVAAMFLVGVLLSAGGIMFGARK